MKKQEPVTHIVKSFDGGNNLRYTRHTSLADAQKEKRHRITEAFHRYVMILTVEEIHVSRAVWLSTGRAAGTAAKANDSTGSPQTGHQMT